MTFPKFLAFASVFLFATIGILAFFKSHKRSPMVDVKVVSSTSPISIALEREIQIVQPQAIKVVENPTTQERSYGLIASTKVKVTEKPLPEADRISELFNKGGPRLPIVETIIYKSRVPWLKGRPAWLSDYASYYGTSRHFIARSLNGCRDYLKQEVADGDSFNVYRKDKDIQFYLLVDISRCKMWFYVVDLDLNKRTLLKTYTVGLGRLNSERVSGLLTPLGKYALGDKVAIYRPKIEGIYNGQKVEMIRVFGTRWIPFEKEISDCTAPAKSFGFHGVPWSSSSGILSEDCTSLGKYESDGCIRLATEDVEEIFAILLGKPAVIELVKNFFDAKLPGTE